MARLQPVEVYAMREAARWRRNRRLEELVLAAALIANRIPFNDRVLDTDRVLQSVAGYDDGTED